MRVEFAFLGSLLLKTTKPLIQGLSRLRGIFRAREHRAIAALLPRGRTLIGIKESASPYREESSQSARCRDCPTG